MGYYLTEISKKYDSCLSRPFFFISVFTRVTDGGRLMNYSTFILTCLFLCLSYCPVYALLYVFMYVCSLSLSFNINYQIVPFSVFMRITDGHRPMYYSIFILTCLFLCLSLCLSICKSVCLSFCIKVYYFIFFSFYESQGRPTTCVLFYLHFNRNFFIICPIVLCMSVRLFLCLSAFINLSLSLSFSIFLSLSIYILMIKSSLYFSFHESHRWPTTHVLLDLHFNLSVSLSVFVSIHMQMCLSVYLSLYIIVNYFIYFQFLQESPTADDSCTTLSSF